MILSDARLIADKVMDQLRPYCERIAIAGSIRRKKPEVKDIEIVAIPKPYETGLFESGIATVVNKWTKVKGDLPCKYTQRILPEGIKLDLFFAEPGNWGLIYAIRTGSADYSHKVLATAWVKAGYNSVDGYLFHSQNQKRYDVREEIHNLGAKQRLILDYLKQGYYIKQVHDVFTMERWIDLTDEDGNDIMSVPPRTVRSLVERGLVTKSDWWPCLQINIIEFRLKPSI